MTASEMAKRVAELTVPRGAPADRRGAVTAAAVFGLVAAGASAWIWSATRAEVVEIVPVKEERLPSGMGPPASVFEVSGYVTASRHATISSKITGRLEEILVTEGARVAERQVVARIDDSAARGELRLAEAVLSTAARTLDQGEVEFREANRALGRSRSLFEGGVVSQSDLDAAAARAETLGAQRAVAREQLRVAEQQVALKRQDLEDTVIRTPFAGVVTSLNAQAGEMISPISAGGGFTRTGICTVVDMKSLEVEADVREDFIDRVRAGQPATVTFAAYPGWRVPARVALTMPAADRSSATVRVRFTLETTDPRILPNMSVKVALQPTDAPVARATPSRLYVPRDAITHQGQDDVLYAVADGRAQRRVVRAGAEGTDRLVEVLSGLHPGESVIVRPPPGLADGASVRGR
jgi:RND family efflux transporter MFP subunit